MLLDGFEDGNLAEWTGQTDTHSASTANPFNGDYSLEVATTSPGSRTITRTDVSWGPNDERTLQCWVDREHSAALLFGVQSADAFYYAQLIDSGTSDTSIQIAKQDSGFSGIDSSALGIDRTAYEWLRLVVDWQTDGAIIISVYDQSATELGSVTATDTTFGAGGVGVDIFTGDSTARTTYVDTIETVQPRVSFLDRHTPQGQIMTQQLPNAYEGEDVPIRVTFTDDSGTEIQPDGATDSTGPTITVVAPDGTDAVSSTVMTSVDTGTYEHTWDTAGDTTGTGSYQVEVTAEFSSETKIAKGTITIS